MLSHAARGPGNHQRRRWPSPSIFIAGAALVVALGSSAIAASGVVHARDIAPGAVTSKALRDGGVMPNHLNASVKSSFGGAQGAVDTKGDTGLTGTSGVNGAGEGKSPIALLLHPGAFIFPGNGMPEAAAAAKARGFVPRYVDYPLRNVPAAVRAAMSAAQQAGKGGRSVVAYGESAGGTLASLLAQKGLVEAAAAQSPVANIPAWLATINADPAYLLGLLSLTPKTALLYSPDQHRTKSPIFAETAAEDVISAPAAPWAKKAKEVKGTTVPGTHLDPRFQPARMEMAMNFLAHQLPTATPPTVVVDLAAPAGN